MTGRLAEFFHPDTHKHDTGEGFIETEAVCGLPILEAHPENGSRIKTIDGMRFTPTKADNVKPGNEVNAGSRRNHQHHPDFVPALLIFLHGADSHALSRQSRIVAEQKNRCRECKSHP